MREWVNESVCAHVELIYEAVRGPNWPSPGAAAVWRAFIHTHSPEVVLPQTLQCLLPIELPGLCAQA
jgi:hypothetical protein